MGPTSPLLFSAAHVTFFSFQFHFSSSSSPPTPPSLCLGQPHMHLMLSSFLCYFHSIIIYLHKSIKFPLLNHAIPFTYTYIYFSSLKQSILLLWTDLKVFHQIHTHMLLTKFTILKSFIPNSYSVYLFCSERI